MMITLCTSERPFSENNYQDNPNFSGCTVELLLGSGQLAPLTTHYSKLSNWGDPDHTDHPDHFFFGNFDFLGCWFTKTGRFSGLEGIPRLGCLPSVNEVLLVSIFQKEIEYSSG